MKRLLVLALLFTACGTNEPPQALDQSASTQDSAIYNFHEVEPGLYRSGELTPASIAVLASKYGIKTIVSVDSYTLNKDAMRFEANAAIRQGINWIWLPMAPIGNLDVKTAMKAESVLERAERPLLFHCYRGSERTGIVAAAYRIKHGWSFESAFAEADTYGFNWMFNEWKKDLQKEMSKKHYMSR